MRSQIPRPDQRFGKIIKIAGRDVILADEVWYRYLTTEHSDTAVIEVESILGLTAPSPNTSQIQQKANEARTLALLDRNYGGEISTMAKQIKTLEALVFGARRPEAASTDESILCLTVIADADGRVITDEPCGTLFTNGS